MPNDPVALNAVALAVETSFSEHEVHVALQRLVLFGASLYVAILVVRQADDLEEDLEEKVTRLIEGYPHRNDPRR